MFTKKFWKKTAERAAKTAGQAAILALGAAGSLDAVHADWKTVGSFALGGAILSVLTSLASLRLGPGDDPSAI